MKKPLHVNLQIFSIQISSMQLGEWVWGLIEKAMLQHTDGFNAMREKSTMKWTAKKKEVERHGKESGKQY